jgi:limonene-1,2-epoxide hydrolase
VLGIWRVENETIVVWSDYTKTKVQLSGTDKDDPYNAFCAALAKKTYGTNSALKKNITKNTYGLNTWVGAQIELAHFHPEMFPHLDN